MAKGNPKYKAVVLLVDPILTHCVFNVPLVLNGSTYAIERLSHYHANEYHPEETGILHEILVQLAQDKGQDYTAVMVRDDSFLVIFHHPSGTPHKTRQKFFDAFKRLNYEEPQITIVDLLR